MTVPADQVYEVVVHEVGEPKSLLRAAFASVAGVFTRGSRPTNPAGMIISVVRTDTADELFRHIEDLSDDEGHLLDGIEQDLASMTANEFAARWGN